MRSFDARYEEVRRDLERSMGSLSQPVWERVVEDGLIKEYLDAKNGSGAPMPWNELASMVSVERERERTYYRHFARSLEASDIDTDAPLPARRRSYKPEGSPTVEPWEAARAEANAMHLAELSNRHPRVRRFREEVLGGDWPLTKDQAE